MVGHIKLEQFPIPVNRTIQFESADQLVDGSNAAETDGPHSVRNLILESLNIGSGWSSKCFRSSLFSRFRLSRRTIVWIPLFTWNVLLLIVVVMCKLLLQSITTHIPGSFHLFRRKITLVQGLVPKRRWKDELIEREGLSRRIDATQTGLSKNFALADITTTTISA